MTQTFSFRLDHVLKRNSRTLLIAILLVVMLGFTAFAAAPAAHAASASTTQTTHCAVVLPPQHEQISRLLCAQGNQPLAVPSSCVVLITVYVDSQFNKNHPNAASTSIFGCAGPCDVAGYHVDMMPSGFNNDISSFKVFNGCNITDAFTLTNETGTCQTYNGNVSFVGATMNDKISSLVLRSAQNGVC